MARNRKDRQEAVDDSGELVQQDGKWYKRVSWGHAWGICRDVQVYCRNRAYGMWIYRDAGPNTYGASRLVSAPWYRKDYDWFVEVEPNREEYTPKHLSNEVATKRESATTRCDHG